MFWYRRDNTRVLVGFTAQDLRDIGEICHFIPRIKIGDRVYSGQAIATVETTSGLRSLVARVDGTVISVNQDMLSDPESVSDQTTLFTFESQQNALFSL